MRRNKLLLGVLLLLSFNGNAQDNFFTRKRINNNEQFIHGGLVAGINASQLDGDTYSGFYKAGLNAGFAAYRAVSTKVIMSLELLYSQKGARFIQIYDSPAVGSVPIEYKASLNYAEIPLMVHYDVGQKIMLGVGLSYSRLISDKEIMDSYTGGPTGHLQNTFKKQDYNYLLGISYELYNGFFARARYQYSIVSVRDAGQIPVQFNTARQYNNLFALQLMYLF